MSLVVGSRPSDVAYSRAEMHGVCLVLLAGVVGVWAGSYAGWLVMDKWSAGRDWGSRPSTGLVSFIEAATWAFRRGRFQFFSTGGDGWTMPATADAGLLWRANTEVSRSWEIIFPLWLPALLLVVLNGFVWRMDAAAEGGPRIPVRPAKKADA